MKTSERRTRLGRATAQTVMIGLILAEQDGLPAAAAVMNHTGVPFRVIVRLLSEPAAQRRPDHR